MMLIVQIVLWFLAVYFLIGFLFGIFFLFIGAPRIDPLISDSKWALRLLLFPGAVATWIFLLPKVFKKS
jgi:hypothetical protein